MNDRTNIPFTDFGGTGEKIHLAHANGYPPGTYLELVEALQSDYHLVAQHYRPLWDDDHLQLKNWGSFADDLITYMHQQELSDLVGIGHSMGATTSMVAAVRQPGLFKKLVMMDPVILPKAYILSSLLPLSLAKKIIPIAKISSKRRDRWESKEALFESFRKKRVFKGISDRGLQLFADHATKPAPEGGIQLAYSKEWETQVYCSAVYPWRYLKKIDIPILFIKAEHSNVISDSIWNKIQSTVQNGTFVEVKDTSHLIPMEEPAKVAQIIKDWL